MGFTTVVVINNDALDQLRKNPDEFVQGVNHALNYGGTVSVGNYANPVDVIKSEHSSEPQIVMAWQGMAYSMSHYNRDFLDLVDRRPDLAEDMVDILDKRVEYLRRLVNEAKTLAEGVNK